MRHLRNFENNRNEKTVYCLFIAPQLHIDTVNTFWTSVRYEYEGKKQNIIPLTTKQFCDILLSLIELKRANRPFTHLMLEALFVRITNEAQQIVPNSRDWIAHIPQILTEWRIEIAN